MKRALCLFVGVLIAFSAGNLLAQITGGSIVGMVTDRGGASVANATVQATNTETHVVNKTTTSASGSYEFPLLPVGRYLLIVEAPGFQRATSDEIILRAGTKPRRDFAMGLGQVSDSVEVTATTTLMNVTNTELGVVIDTGKMRDMPLNGRDFKQLVSLQPGWNAGGCAANRGGVEVSRTPGLGSNFMLDGDMSFRETNGVGLAAAGASGTRINTGSVEAIEEFKTVSGAFSAEYVHSVGAVINPVTKSGTNALHGTLFEFLRNDKLVANTFFSNCSGLPKPALRHNQYGANLGGPIWRDKIFFFFNYEGAKVRQERIISGNVPTPFMLSQITNPQLAKDLNDTALHGNIANRPSDMSDERQVVETASSAIYINMRSRQGRHLRAYAWSNHDGATWSKVESHRRVPEPSCQGSVVNPASPDQRARLTARISYDECQNWPVSKVVSEGSAGYSDLAIAPDMSILCFYDSDQQFAGKNPYESDTGRGRYASQERSSLCLRYQPDFKAAALPLQLGVAY